MAASRSAPKRRPGEVLDRTIRVRFDGNVDHGLPWTFAPVQQTMDVKIGETALAFFKATNQTSAPVSGTAIFNVAPELASRYFTKIECFCFKQQTLAGGQSVEMPVTFFVDPKIVDDEDTKNMSEITLSYTFYRADKDADESRVRAGRRWIEIVREQFRGACAESEGKRTGENDGRSARQASRLPSRQSKPVAHRRCDRRLHARGRRGHVFHLEEGRHAEPLLRYPRPAIVIFTMFGWWRDVIKEAQEGYETPVVQLHLRYGMILFIASEVMFFVAWFWAYFDAALYPDDAITYARTAVLGGQWPPIPSADTGVAGLGDFQHTFNPWGLPFVNTLILLLSGTTVTWAHQFAVE